MIKPTVKKKDLFVKTSQLPKSGKGLFTRKLIPKGSLIVEYRGLVTTWKEAKHEDGDNGYIYYITRNRVIDARPYKSYLARYANDARGLTRVKSLQNNAAYDEKDGRVFIKALKDIPAGSEILVGYGKEYWAAIRYNKKLEEKQKKAR